MPQLYDLQSLCFLHVSAVHNSSTVAFGSRLALLSNYHHLKLYNGDVSSAAVEQARRQAGQCWIKLHKPKVS